jgi:hypothetical protein
LTLAIGIAMPALAALKMSIPMACSNDFRYVWPVRMPTPYLYARAVARLALTTQAAPRPLDLTPAPSSSAPGRPG